MNQIGKSIVIIGAILIIIGIVIIFKDNIPGLKKLGNLPGDIKIEKGNVKIYIPIMTSILLSMLLTAILYLFKK